MIYVGSAEDQSQDQVLEEVLVGPVPVGVNKFLLQVRSYKLKLYSLNTAKVAVVHLATNQTG